MRLISEVYIDDVALIFMCRKDVTIGAVEKLLRIMEKRGFVYTKSYISKKEPFVCVDGKDLRTDISDSDVNNWGFSFSYKDLGFFVNFLHDNGYFSLTIPIHRSYFLNEKAKTAVAQAKEVFTFIVKNFADYILFAAADQGGYIFTEGNEIEDVYRSLTISPDAFWLYYLKRDYWPLLKTDVKKILFTDKINLDKGVIIQSAEYPHSPGIERYFENGG